jgi:hypothetical protein
MFVLSTCFSASQFQRMHVDIPSGTACSVPRNALCLPGRIASVTRPRLGRTPDGRRLELASEIDASPAAAWDLLVDTRRWPEWGPSVRAVDCEDERIGAGSTGRVRIPGGLRVPFEVDAFSPLPADPAEGDAGRWTWRVARIPATGHRVEALPDSVRVVFELPVLAAGYAPVCWRALDRIDHLLEPNP